MKAQAKAVLDFFVRKLKEPSTYAAMAAIFAATGLITPEQQAQFDVVIPQLAQNVSLLASGISTLLGVIMNEDAKKA